MKVRKLPRRINTEPAKPTKSNVSISIEQSHARQIYEMPLEQRKVVIAALVENVRYSDLIAFIAEQGWLTVSEKTFKQYLTAFKRVYPELIVREDNESDLSGLVDPRQPGIDPVVMLEQLVRAQSQRIRVGMDFEKQTSILNQHMHKDIRTQRENLQELAVLKGLVPSGAGRPSSEAANDQRSNNVQAQEAIRDVDKKEGAQEKLVGTMGTLLDLLQRKNKQSEAISSKA